MKKVIMGLRQFMEKHSEFINSFAKGVIAGNSIISSGGGGYIELS